jgi:hypothetical protein
MESPMDRYADEEAAVKAFGQLMEQARQCRSLYERAGVAIPDRLSRFLGTSATVDRTKPEHPTISVPPPEPPPRPADWKEGWIWIPAAAANVSSLIRGILRAQGAPMTPKQIIEELGKYKSEVSAGSVANIGTRLNELGHIERSNGFWFAPDASKFPVIHEGFVWGEQDIFEAQEVAAYRRICLLHVLRAHPDGLQTVQLTKTLGMCRWLRAPLSKDLVKADLEELLSEQKVRKVGHSGKYNAL